MNKINRDALYKELDQSGGFVKNVDGSLEPDSLIKLRRIATKHVQETV